MAGRGNLKTLQLLMRFKAQPGAVAVKDADPVDLISSHASSSASALNQPSSSAVSAAASAFATSSFPIPAPVAAPAAASGQSVRSDAMRNDMHRSEPTATAGTTGSVAAVSTPLVLGKRTASSLDAFTPASAHHAERVHVPDTAAVAAADAVPAPTPALAPATPLGKRLELDAALMAPSVFATADRLPSPVPPAISAEADPAMNTPAAKEAQAQLEREWEALKRKTPCHEHYPFYHAFDPDMTSFSTTGLELYRISPPPLERVLSRVSLPLRLYAYRVRISSIVPRPLAHLGHHAFCGYWLLTDVDCGAAPLQMHCAPGKRAGTAEAETEVVVDGAQVVTVTEEQLRLLHEFTALVGLFADRWRASDPHYCAPPHTPLRLDQTPDLDSVSAGERRADRAAKPPPPLLDALRERSVEGEGAFLAYLMPACVRWDHEVRQAVGSWLFSFDLLEECLTRTRCDTFLYRTAESFHIDLDARLEMYRRGENVREVLFGCMLEEFRAHLERRLFVAPHNCNRLYTVERMEFELSPDVQIIDRSALPRYQRHVREYAASLAAGNSGGSEPTAAPSQHAAAEGEGATAAAAVVEDDEEEEDDTQETKAAAAHTAPDARAEAVGPSTDRDDGGPAAGGRVPRGPAGHADGGDAATEAAVDSAAGSSVPGDGAAAAVAPAAAVPPQSSGAKRRWRHTPPPPRETLAMFVQRMYGVRLRHAHQPLINAGTRGDLRILHAPEMVLLLGMTDDMHRHAWPFQQLFARLAWLARFTAFEQRTGVRLENKLLARRVFTPKSAGDSSTDNYERLEFLGDAVLDWVVSHRLFMACPDDSEGRLTLIRSNLVRNEELWKVAWRLGMARLLVDRQRTETVTYLLPERYKLLSDVFEAYIGAITLDQGLGTACYFIDRNLLACTLPRPLYPCSPTFQTGQAGELAVDHLEQQLRDRIGVSSYSFRHRELFAQAFTPASVCGSARCNYERLEFLGDALLKMVCALQHYRQHPISNESTLTWRRAEYVCRDNLGQHLLDLGMDALVGQPAFRYWSCRRPHADFVPQARDPTIKQYSDVFEALVGAMFFDRIEGDSGQLEAFLTKNSGLVFERMLVQSRTHLDGHEGLAAVTAFLGRLDFFGRLLRAKRKE